MSKRVKTVETGEMNEDEGCLTSEFILSRYESLITTCNEVSLKFPRWIRSCLHSKVSLQSVWDHWCLDLLVPKGSTVESLSFISDINIKLHSSLISRVTKAWLILVVVDLM